jgi:dihydroorotate dehydrogenase subfamily 1
VADLNVNLHGIKLKNPIMPGSGPTVRNAESMMQCAKQGVSALVTKTISEKPIKVPKPCMQEAGNGIFLNCELWSEIPAEQWIENEYEKCREAKVPLFVNVGYTEEEIEKIAPIVAPYADVIELSTHYMGKDIQPVINSLKAASKAGKPVYIKLNPGITKIGWYVKRLVEEGADGFVAVNSLGPCMHIDVETGLPFMGSEMGYGWLSGKALNPIALRFVYSIANSVKVPVIGCGGISSGEDVAAMLMAGASAVEICTAAILEGHSAYGRIINEFNEWLDSHNYCSANDIIGLTAKKIQERNLQDDKYPKVDEDNCTACGLCERGCLYDAVEIISKAKIDPEKCSRCGLCVSRCPVKAIKY